jgi:hypothetical protein
MPKINAFPGEIAGASAILNPVEVLLEPAHSKFGGSVATRLVEAIDIPIVGTNEANRQRALQLFPEAHALLARRLDHGRAEAGLPALYGAQQ